MIMPRDDETCEMRLRMVEEQIAARGIRDSAVLDAMRAVPRENFVPSSLRGEAYEDNPLPIIHGQTISQPYIVALMSELLELPHGGGLNLLEVGTGSGYQAAVLAAMGHRVTTVERIPEVASFARDNLDSVSWGENVRVETGDGCLGFPELAPYDGILITAAAPKIPDAILEQLKTGCRLVIPCGDCFIQQMLQVVRRENGSIMVNKGIGCRFVPLLGRDGFQPE